MRARLYAACVAVTACVAGAVYAVSENGYEIQIVMPSAANLVDGSPVQIEGHDVGEVTELITRDNKAVVTVSLSGEDVPLREGTTARVEWKAAVGSRIVALEPGRGDNPELPDGAMIEAQADRVEVDDVLAALDPPTRKRLSSLLRELNGTVRGKEADLKATLTAAGPTVRALGEVLQAVGQDGPAIRALVTRLHEMTRSLAGRHDQIRSVVADLGHATGVAAGQHDGLREGLGELPGTLDAVNRTLAQVPEASAAATAFLSDLRPGTAKLPAMSRNLAPVLRDLRPTVAELRPALTSLSAFLTTTPALLDTAHSVLPGTGSIMKDAVPAMAFLRPYTPELAGFLSNWASAFAPFDAHGHFVRQHVISSASGGTDNPSVLPPGLHRRDAPAPGANEGQPWTDANGSGMR